MIIMIFEKEKLDKYNARNVVGDIDTSPYDDDAKKALLKSVNDAISNITVTDALTHMAAFAAELTPNGYWKQIIHNLRQWQVHIPENATYADIAIAIAELTGADLNDPRGQAAHCTCPTECDCQDYDNGLVSNECPIHNEVPSPRPDCPRHGEFLPSAKPYPPARKPPK